MKRNILVFPCGSEIGLEVYNSLKFSTHFNLVGGSSVDDHGRFVYENYVGNLPFFDDIGFKDGLLKVISRFSIDAIYPAMDAVAAKLKELESELPCGVVGSSVEATSVCASKIETYRKLESLIPLPKYSVCVDQISEYPVFVKPDRGYGSRNQIIASSRDELDVFLNRNRGLGFVFCEVLPGVEFTVDCFSDKNGVVMFAKPRLRSRISNGISVNTVECHEYADLMAEFAKRISQVLALRGAWFFQMKLGDDGSPRLLEVAARLGGSSSLFRMKGVNFAALTLYDHFGVEVSISENDYKIELDRALSSRYKVDLSYRTVYIDYDDCIVREGEVNTVALAFVFKSISLGRKVVLITRHQGDLAASLHEHRIGEVFDEIIHIRSASDRKSSYIAERDAIFVDDSYSEREDVRSSTGIPVFSPEMVEALI